MMAFIAMMLCTNLSAWAQVTVDSPWVGAAIENGKAYYLYNTKAKAFLKGANSWGTQASLGEDAVAFTAEGSDGVYKLRAAAYNNYLGIGLFVDQAAQDFAFTEVGTGIYTFTLNGEFVGFNGSSVVAKSASENDGCYWQLLTKESMAKDMAAAGAAKPYSATAFIDCANFGRNQNASAWSNGPALGGDNGNFCAEKWNAGITSVKQTVTGLPNGTYELKAQAFYRGAAEYDVQIVANEYGTQVMHIDVDASKMGGVAPNTMGDASRFFSAGYYENNPVLFTVTDGTATIGIEKFTSVGSDWLIFDNFRLTYYGTATIAEVELEKLREYIDEVTALVEAAKAIEAIYTEEAKAELDAAVAEAEKILAAPTKEELIAVVEPLEVAIARAEKSAGINAAVGDNKPTAEEPIDLTEFVVNPNMDGNLNGWANTGWSYQGASYTNGNVTISKFQEIWVWNADLGNKSTSQTMVDMPAGTYRLSADLIAVRQGSSSPVSGAKLFINDAEVAVATGNEAPETFSVEVVAKEGVITFGFKGENTNANWMAMDNVKLELVSVYDAEVAGSLLVKAVAELDQLNGKSSMNVLLGVYHNIWLPMSNEMHTVLDNLADYNDIAVLDAMTAEVEKTIATIEEISAVYVNEYMPSYQLTEDAMSYSTPLNEEVAAALADAMEAYGPSKLYAVKTKEELLDMAAELKAAYVAYVPYAEASEGYLFDLSFMIEDPAAVSQVVKGLPAGTYSLHAVVAASAETLFTMTAGDASITYRGTDANKGYDMALGNINHKGGDLAFEIAGNGIKVENIRIYCEGDNTIVPELYTLAASPEEGTMLEALINFTLTYESAVAANEACTETIKITNPKGRVLAEASLAQCAFDGNNVTVTLADTLVTSGNIKVLVPAGMFLVQSLIDERKYETAGFTLAYQFALEPVEVESPWSGATVANGLKAYLYNPAKKAFLAAGNSWGTQASYDATGLLWTVAGADETYTLASTVSNGGESHFFTGTYVDGGATNVVIKEVGVDVYTLKVGAMYIGSDDTSIVTNVAELDSTCYWQFVTVEERTELMKAGSVSKPGDATFLVRGANFSRNDLENAAWSGSPAIGGDNHVGFAGEIFNAATAEVAQEIKNVPNGVYRMDVQGFYRMGGHGAGPATEHRKNGTEVIPAYFFANTEKVQVMSIIDEAGKMNEGVEFGDYGMAPNDMGQAVRAFKAGLYEHSIVFTVTDGTIKLGMVKTAGVENDWTMFDNFRLAYLGEKNDVDYLGEGMIASIAEGDHYVFYTDAEGKNHFLNAAGANNWVVTAIPTTIKFSAGNTADGSFASAASFMASNGFYMSNAANSDGSGAIKTEAITGGNGQAQRTWESQVFYKNKEGKYAIRLTNSTGTGWGANCFVNIDPATLAVISGQPTLADALYLWNIASADDPRFSTEVLAALIEEAEAIEGVYNKDVEAALAAAIAAAKGATAAEVEAAQAELEEAIAAAKASIADYKAILKAVADAKVVMFETADAYAELTEAIKAAEAAYADATATEETLAMVQEAKAAYLAANEVEGLVNGTFGDANAASTEGWTGDMITGKHNKWTNVNDGFAEKWTGGGSYLADMDFYQEVSGLPAGTYTFMVFVNACQQSNDDSHEVTGVYVYANNNAIAVHTINIDRDAANQAIGAELVMVTATIQEGETLKVGMKIEGTDANWVVMDNAKLYNFKNAATSDPSTGIVNLENANANTTVYSIDGKSIKTSLNNLEKGLYIVNGKKVYIK